MHTFCLDIIWRQSARAKIPLWSISSTRFLWQRSFQLRSVGSWCLSLSLLLRNVGKKVGKICFKADLGCQDEGQHSRWMRMSGHLNSCSEQTSSSFRYLKQLSFKQCLNSAAPAGRPLESCKVQSLKFHSKLDPNFYELEQNKTKQANKQMIQCLFNY